MIFSVTLRSSKFSNARSAYRLGPVHQLGMGFRAVLCAELHVGLHGPLGVFGGIPSGRDLMGSGIEKWNFNGISYGVYHPCVSPSYQVILRRRVENRRGNLPMMTIQVGGFVFFFAPIDPVIKMIQMKSMDFSMPSFFCI